LIETLAGILAEVAERDVAARVLPALEGEEEMRALAEPCPTRVTGEAADESVKVQVS
jgi:hypothetical protein